MTADDVPLRDYLEKCLQSIEGKLDAQKDFNALHFNLNEQAIKKAEESMTSRLEGMNEFRDQIKDERINLATKDITFGLDERIKRLELSEAKIAGKADQKELVETRRDVSINQLVSYAALLIGLAGMAVTIYTALQG